MTINLENNGIDLTRLQTLRWCLLISPLTSAVYLKIMAAFSDVKQLHTKRSWSRKTKSPLPWFSYEGCVVSCIHTWSSFSIADALPSLPLQYYSPVLKYEYFLYQSEFCLNDISQFIGSRASLVSSFCGLSDRLSESINAKCLRVTPFHSDINTFFLRTTLTLSQA